MKRHIYRILPARACSDSEWKRADAAINGMDHRGDFNEAIALAHLFRLNTQAPFEVEMISPPYKGARVTEALFWEVN